MQGPHTTAGKVTPVLREPPPSLSRPLQPAWFLQSVDTSCVVWPWVRQRNMLQSSIVPASALQPRAAGLSVRSDFSHQPSALRFHVAAAMVTESCKV